MSYGLQISASGVAAAMYRQDVYANNLANMDTPGYKPDIPSTRFRESARSEDGLMLPSNAMLERLGAGVLLNPNRTSYAQGSLRDTGNPLDFAISGDGYFVVRDERDGLKDRLHLTRDGRFTKDSRGRVVLASSGLPLLSTSNDEIVLTDPAPIKVDTDGTIRQRGQTVAKIQFVQVPDTSALEKLGHSLFGASASAIDSASESTGSIRQNALEESGADEILTIMDMTAASRDADSNTSMIQQHDRLLDRAINVLGRVT